MTAALKLRKHFESVQILEKQQKDTFFEQNVFKIPIAFTPSSKEALKEIDV